jgi:GTP-binding protein EngB required for normal cell division
MVLKFHSTALSGLCSKDQLDLLDAVDTLRSQGINHYISLPQIIVCGDQSSGKSSVLEAISGVAFPVKSNLCTRFPTELVLRKTAYTGVSVSIVPHPSRNEAEKLSLGGFREELNGFEGLPALIENAKAAMGITQHGKAFSKDLLRVEVSGPDRPHLTIVDLPGLIHSETKYQTAADVELVQDVVQAYMKEPRSIILAVVSAKNDYANQIVLKLARTADKGGVRTLGVITKPDTLKPGSDSEAMYVSLARNQDVEFRLGWHILKNMDSEIGESSLADRDAKEEDFFSKGIWADLPSQIKGIDTLRERLSKLLLRQIAAELPNLIDEIEDKSHACQRRLDKLGKPRVTLAEQRIYLVNISQHFQSLVKSAVDGTYNDPFFGDAQFDSDYQKRIRAVIQNLNIEFAARINERGHLRRITDSQNTKNSSGNGELITRDDYLKHVEHLMRRTRGRELPGTFNPMIVADLFWEQSLPWEDLADEHIDKSWKAARTFLKSAVTHVADAATSKSLYQNVFVKAIDEILGALQVKANELIGPHQNGHPITYNHYFTETLQKVRSSRRVNEYSEVVGKFFGQSDITEVEQIRGHFTLSKLVTALVGKTEPDMSKFASSEALDCMEAYYKVHCLFYAFSFHSYPSAH